MAWQRTAGCITPKRLLQVHHHQNGIRKCRRKMCRRNQATWPCGGHLMTGCSYNLTLFQ